MRCFKRAAEAGFVIPALSPEVLGKTFPGTQCRLLDGKLVASMMHDQCRTLVKSKPQPKLVAILAGEDPASQVYVGNKSKTFANVNFASETIRIPSSESTDASLLALVDKLNANPGVHGILVQLPLPASVNAAAITNRIAPAKDVDGFLPLHAGTLATGDFGRFLPCTPFGVMVLLAAYGIPIAGSRTVVVGRSNIVGKPMSFLAQSEDATVTMAHSRTKDLPAICREADLLIVAAGKPNLINRDFVKPGATVVDVGIHRLADGTLCGDVNANVREVAGALTPVPGGVGPLTIAMLCVNTALAAWN
jgi:methylenetetrahydrofolate dehydrogenase (NADP+)/methenyltetrahydrofolate cyclohydrolase